MCAVTEAVLPTWRPGLSSVLILALPGRCSSQGYTREGSGAVAEKHARVAIKVAQMTGSYDGTKAESLSIEFAWSQQDLSASIALGTVMVGATAIDGR